MNELVSQLKSKGIRVKYDDGDNQRPGWKFAQYELKGVPVRLAIGARDLEKNVIEIARRDTREKYSVSMDGLSGTIVSVLDEIQQAMFNKALSFREEHITKVDTWDEFEKVLDRKGRFYFCPLGWDNGDRRKDQGTDQGHHPLHTP